MPDRPSPEWERARSRTVAEDEAQRRVVAFLTQPIAAKDTAGQARRVDGMQRLVRSLPEASADRLHSRLTNKNDPLGQLFDLELHRQTRSSLLSLLDAQRRHSDRGDDPSKRGTDQRTATPVTPTKDPVDPSAFMWPKWRAAKPSTDPPPWADPKTVPVPPPVVPIPKGGPTLPGGKPPSDPFSNLITLSAMGLTAVIGGLMHRDYAAKGIKAAWEVFLLADTMNPKQVIGLAVEKALLAMLPERLKLTAKAVMDLNSIVNGFAVLDTSTQKGLISCKGPGLLSEVVPFGQDDAIDFHSRSIANDVLAMSGYDNHPKSRSKLARAAELLFNNRGRIGEAWPKDLKAASVEGIKKYIIEKSMVATFDDYVEPAKRHLAEKLLELLESGDLEKFNGVSLKKSEWKAWIKKQTDRVIGIGFDSDDMIEMMDAAIDLPKRARDPNDPTDTKPFIQDSLRAILRPTKKKK